MVNLSIQDSIDGHNKIQMLKDAIGKEFSNGSSMTISPDDFMPGNLSKIN